MDYNLMYDLENLEHHHAYYSKYPIPPSSRLRNELNKIPFLHVLEGDFLVFNQKGRELLRI